MRVLQVTPWSNCKNHCEFCSQRGDRHFLLEERRANLIDIKEKILNGYYDDNFEFDGLGIIGGEFFAGQLDGLQKEWFELVEVLSDKLKSGRYQQVWINSNLIDVDLDLIRETFNKFDWESLKEDQEVLLPTSYDTKGRFHTEQAKETWYKNVKQLHEEFPKLSIYGTAVTTQAFVEELLSDSFVYPEGMKALNLLVPRLTDADYLVKSTHEGHYRELMKEKLKEYPEWFFPKSREQFIEFLYKVREVLGEGVLRNFYDVECHSSDVITYFPNKNVFFVNRHQRDNNKENMACGHPHTSCCYIDSDKCSHCDAQKVIKYK